MPVKFTEVGVSSLIVRFPGWSSVGRSFTAETVSKKLPTDVAPSPSVTEIEIVTVPAWFGAGVTVTVRLDNEPPKTMFESGTIVISEEAAPKVRLPLAVSASPIVKLMAETGVSSSVNRLVIGLIDGRAFTCVVVLAELLADTGSGVDENAETESLMFPAVVAEPTIVMVAEAPASRVPRLQLTRPPLGGLQTPIVV